jgi:hypothetical protein
LAHFFNEITILLFEYEYRFTEYEYEKSQWYELPATIMPDGLRILSNPWASSASGSKVLA